MRKYFLAAMSFLLLLCCAPALMAQSTPAKTKEANIRKLLKMMDAGDSIKSSMEVQISEFRSSMPQVPPKFWDEVLKEVDLDKFIELLIPIYDKHFSNTDIKAMIAFYETPVGKKYLSKLPQVTTEMEAIGEKYGEQIGHKVIKRMQAEGTFPSVAPAGDGKPSPYRR